MTETDQKKLTHEDSTYGFTHFLSDNFPENSVFYKDFWKKLITGSTRSFVGIEVVTFETEVFACLENNTEYKNLPVIILLDGQAIYYQRLQEYLERGQYNYYIANSNGVSNDRFFDFNLSVAEYKNYCGASHFVPHNERSTLISALSSRYEPHRWLIISQLINHQKLVKFSFHNHENVSLEKFKRDCHEMLCFPCPRENLKTIEWLNAGQPFVLGTPPVDPAGKIISYNQWNDLSAYRDSILNFTLEGDYIDHGYGVNLTEKTYKCFASGTFPIHIGSSGGYSYFETMGFDFSHCGIDLTYDKNFVGDSAKTRYKKIDSIFRLCKEIKNNDKIEYLCRKNFAHFHDGGWLKNVNDTTDREMSRLCESLGKFR